MTARLASKFLFEHECCLTAEGDTHLSRDQMFFSGYNIPGLFPLIANDYFRKDQTEVGVEGFELQ